MKLSRKILWSLVTIASTVFIEAGFISKLISVKTNGAIVNQLSNSDSAYIGMEAARSVSFSVGIIATLIMVVVLYFIWNKKEVEK